MAARSVTIKIQNDFDVALVRSRDSLQHGIWGAEPPARIEPGTTGQGVAESSGVATGTEGTVWYWLDIPGTTEELRFHWDNPFAASNNYDQSGPPVVTVVRIGDGKGNESTAHWVVADASTTGDGIPDAWKTGGATIDPGGGVGPQFVDLPAMGATVGRADLFVHLDWMQDASHSHRPSDAAIRLVVEAFANAPYIARNGAVGINLHVDAGPASILDFATGATWGALSRAASVGEVAQLGTGTVDAENRLGEYDWTDFEKLKNRTGGLTQSGRASIFRYAVAAHQLAASGSSGVARQPGSDFVISLGTFTGVTDVQTAGTFMHELGHNLGLGHGGSDDVNHKPNYPSVMSYLWQFSGINRNGGFEVDYSRVVLAVLNELALDETKGLGPGAAGYGTSRWIPAVGAFVPVANAAAPIDWDGDGFSTSTSLAADINRDGGQGTLAPCNDWQVLRLRGGAIGAGGYAPPPMVTTVPRELTPADQARILPPDTTPPTTTATVWPPPNAAGWNRTPVDVTLAATDDGSGVARTEYDLDGVGPVSYTAPVEIAAEGVHRLGYRSVDLSQNVEARQELTVRLDLTAPELVISYDPIVDDLVVEGRDGLSGVVASPVAPRSRSDVEWTSFGSDVAELRVYEVRDRADNATTLYLKVRCSPLAYEASVLAIRYDDAGHAHEVDEAGEIEQLSSVASGRDRHGSRRRVPRNTMVFERLVGRGAAAPLLGVRQVVAIGSGEGRRTTRARWDALDDYTILRSEEGAGSCGPCADPDERERDERERDERERDERERDERERDERERDERERDEREQDEREWAGQHSRAAAEGSGGGCCGDVVDDVSDDEVDPQDGSDGDGDRRPCGPRVVAESDVRGLVLLRVSTEDGRLHVSA